MPDGSAVIAPRLTTKERVILSAIRLSCLSFHCPYTPEDIAHDAAQMACEDDHDANYPALKDLAGRIAYEFTDPERLAVDRIRAAIEGRTGTRRIIAAYRANAGVLSPADVEAILKS